MELGKLIGTGRTAEVYAYGPDKIVKLYLDWCRPEWVDDEFRTAQTVQSLGISAPYASEVIEINGRRGIVYEYVHGTTMLNALTAKPWLVYALARRLAEGHVEIHRAKIVGPPSLKHRLRNEIVRLDDSIGVKALAALEELPDAQAVCHGDYHPDNVILSGDKLVTIDWMNSAIGHPLADVARTLLMLSSPYIPPETPAKPLVRLLKGLFRHTYLARYVQLTGVTLEEIKRWMIPVAAARLTEEVPGEKEYLLRLIKDSPRG